VSAALLCRDCGSRRCACWRPDPRRLASAPALSLALAEQPPAPPLASVVDRTRRSGDGELLLPRGAADLRRRRNVAARSAPPEYCFIQGRSYRPAPLLLVPCGSADVDRSARLPLQDDRLQRGCKHPRRRTSAPVTTGTSRDFDYDTGASAHIVCVRALERVTPAAGWKSTSGSGRMAFAG
jgi:hypothetical protein